MEIGTEAAKFPRKEYINGIFIAVCGQGGDATHHYIVELNMTRGSHWQTDSQKSNIFVRPDQG